MKRLRNTKIIFFICLFLNLNLIMSVQAVYLKTLGISASFISMLYVISPIFGAALEVPTGVLGDYIGRKKTLILCGFCFSASALLYLLGKSPIHFLMVVFLEALGWSLFSGNTEAIVVEDSLAKKTDISKQIAFFYTGLPLGAAIAGFLNTGVSIYLGNINFKVIILLSVVTKLIALALTFFVNVTPSQIEKSNKSNPFKVLADSISLIRRDFFSLTMIVYEASGRLVFYLPIIIQMLLLKNDVDLKYFGFLIATTLVISTVFQNFSHIIIEKLSIEFILKISPFGFAIGLAILLIPNPVATIAGMIMVEIISPLRGQCLGIQRNRVVENSYRATYISCLSLLVSLVNTVFLMIAGFFLEYSIQLAVGFLLLICLIGGLSTVRFITNIPNEVKNEEQKQVV
ncbi:MAG: MFS transporter [Clostridia bacterium]|nr:MFS transporter [Clostridia bacterium]